MTTSTANNPVSSSCFLRTIVVACHRWYGPPLSPSRSMTGIGAAARDAADARTNAVARTKCITYRIMTDQEYDMPAAITMRQVTLCHAGAG